MKYLGMFLACICAIFLAGSGEAGQVSERSPELYPATAVVIGFDAESDEVFAEDYNGNVWAFTGIEDWEVGDFAAFVMSDAGTESVYDDEIVSVRYAGCGSWNR